MFRGKAVGHLFVCGDARPRAVATLAVPTIISQVVTMIYNLADTFFIG